MKSRSVLAAAMFAAWLAMAPLASAQAPEFVPAMPGAAAGRNFNGIPSRTFGRITANNMQNVNGTNRNNMTPLQVDSAARSQGAWQNSAARPLDSRVQIRPYYPRRPNPWLQVPRGANVLEGSH
jgi:hypothetical protein